MELALRKALWHRGYRYRKNYKNLPGKPDIVLTKQKIAIFCDSEFFHGDGSWIRLYPMPFRLLKDEQKYPKYTWIEVNIERNFSDFRKESFRPDISSIFVEPKPKVDWEERRKILLKNTKIYTNKQTLIQKAKDRSNPISLALFKPAKIIDFIIEKDNRGWDAKKLASLEEQSRQLNLFQTIEQIENEFRVVKKVPYKFSYRFEDDEGKKSTLMIEDWEIDMQKPLSVTSTERLYIDFLLPDSCRIIPA